MIHLNGQRAIIRARFRGGIVASILLTLWVSATANDSQGDMVHIAGSAWVGDAPTWIADQSGLFNHGLADGEPRIAIQLHGSGLEALEYLLEGKAEFALAATTPTALALAGLLDGTKGQPAPIAVLASIALSNQSHYVVSPAGHGIQTPADLVGRRVAIMHGTSSHFGWTQFTAFHGLDDADIELINMPVADMAAGLKAGDIDAAVIWQPWDLSLRQALDDPVTILPMRMLYTINWLLLAHRDFISEHPDVAERVLRAYVKAIELIDSDPVRAAQLHSAAIGVEVDALAPLAERMLWRVSMNWSVLVNLGTQFEWLASWPSLSEIVTPQPRDYLFAQPLKRVAPELVTLPDYLLAAGQSAEDEP